MVEVRPSVVRRCVVRDDQRTGRQLGLEQLGHRKVELLPAVEQYELNRAVDARQCRQGITFEDGDQIVEPRLGERPLRRCDLRRTELRGDDSAGAVVADR
jgi:hypothetical protein